MPIPAYTVSDVIRWLGQHEVDKAKPYIERVRSLAADGNQLNAWVQGKAASPYRTEVKFASGRKGTIVDTSCSCPVAYDCKHGAAVLLAWLDQLGELERDPESPLRVIEAPLQPVLRVATTPVYAMQKWRRYGFADRELLFDFAQLSFRYGNAEIAAHSQQDIVPDDAGASVRVRRDREGEAKQVQLLSRLGMQLVPERVLLMPSQKASVPRWGLARAGDWPAFVRESVPWLVKHGWVVEFAPRFRHRVAEVTAWHATVADGKDGWFSLALDITVDGTRIPLAPLLADLADIDRRWLNARALAAIKDEEMVNLVLPGETLAAIPAGRLKPLFTVLIDLFDQPSDQPLKLAAIDAPRVRTWLTDDASWKVTAPASFATVARRLAGTAAAKPMTEPKGFTATLRDYQRAGLGWLQYLREHELGGILADDMGLGKTAQAIAHIALEKQARRLDRPALVVVPTSLVSNWRDELHRFAPGLSVLTLHGVDRRRRFAAIPDHDVVITTYPLLRHDAKALIEHQYHLLILDEAQVVKNARTHAAQVVRRLAARHRLTLTGTPIENHLGELWSQFDFLMPGLLGDARSFQKHWRTPIEKHGDALRSAVLAKRVRAFILRRSKEDVARELPRKTEMQRSVELTGAQRDLYEAVRSTVDEQVRAVIASRGLAKSQIAILDALLKLRQVCCDPRLVKQAKGEVLTQSVKLDLLLEMLDELVAEGRRVLVFSQFTSMLALIEEALTERDIQYVLLTGTTRDRAAVVKRFQSGTVPVFLISLKAGGVGLNLTAADTVIHYDPWWNPAAEAQATDRAHRIGQNKPVFVYKLTVKGSIEERLLTLQDKKRGLAASVLGNDAIDSVKFTEADVRDLLAPMPEAAN